MTELATIPTDADPSPETDPRDIASLPPLGEGINEENWSKVNAFWDALENKGVKFYKTPCDRAVKNLIVFETGKGTAIGCNEVIVNKIRKDHYSLLSDLLRDPPTRTIVPEESSDPPQMIDVMGTDEFGFPAPMQFPITDKTQADFEKKLVDYFWDKAELDADFEEAMHNASISGWTNLLYWWDRQNMLPKFETTISVQQILLDPIVGAWKAVEKSNWATLRWRVNWWQARAMFPHLAKHLDAKSTTGNDASNSIVPLGNNQDEQETGERMVDLKFLWLRNYPVQRMTPDEALQFGEVEQREVMDEGLAQAGGAEATGTLDATPEQVVTDSIDDRGVDAGAGIAAVGGDGGGDESPDENMPGALQRMPASGGPGPTAGQGDISPFDLAASTVGAVLPNPTAFFLPGGETPVTPASPEWPWFLGIRMLTRVDTAIADDRINPYADIPIVHIPCNPTAMSACGQGYPEVSEHLQAGRNRALTNAVDHSDLMAHPIKVYCKSAWAVLDSEYKEKGASVAGMNVMIDDEIYEKLGGKISITESAEPISASLGEILNILGRELEDQSVAPAVTQGRQTGDVTGWQATQMLQAQAASRLDLPAKFLQHAVKRAMMLVRHSVLWNVPVPRISQICSEYPPEVVEALVQRGRSSDCNINVRVNPTGGGVQARVISDAFQKFGTVDELTGERVIGMDTLRERVDEDNAKEHMRQQPALMQAAAAKQQQEQADRDAKQKPGKETAGASNGNGQSNGDRFGGA